MRKLKTKVLRRRSVSIAAACLLPVACFDALEQPSGPDSAALQISAGPDVGNPYFHWLPPIGTEPTYNGTFDGSLSPVVNICEWTGTDCLLPLVGTFTTEDGPGSETVRVGPEEDEPYEVEHYIVNWHTDRFELAVGSTYRIQVSVAGTALGYADVVMTSWGSSKDLEPQGSVPLEYGRTLPIKFRIEEGAVFVIGPQGGVVSALDGDVTLSFPQGAVAEERGVTVLPIGAISNLAWSLPGPTFLLGPDDLVFAEPVQLSVRFVPAGSDESPIFLSQLQDGGWMPVFESTAPFDAGIVTAQLYRFGIGGWTPPQESAVLLNVAPRQAEAAVSGSQAGSGQGSGPYSASSLLNWLGSKDLAWLEEHHQQIYDKLEKALVRANGLCTQTSDLREKKCLANEVFRLQIIVDHLAFLPGISDLAWASEYVCDGIIDDAARVDIEPSIIDLEPEESRPLTAVAKIGDQAVTGVTAISWVSDDPNVATVEDGVVTAVNPGQTTIIAVTSEAPGGSCEGEPMVLFGTAHVTVEAPSSAVDIVLVAQTEHGSYAFMGFNMWHCPGSLCLDEGWDITWRNAGWWGMGGEPGDIWWGKAQVEDPSVIGISLSKDGPFVSGPINIPFTVKEGYVAWSPRVWIKAFSEGASKVYYCISHPECDPTRYQYGQMWDDITVEGHASPDPDQLPGLSDIGAEVVSALDERFDDYRFGFVGFGQNPSVASCYDMLPEWKPYLEPTPFHDWVDLTDDPSQITGGLGSFRLICSYPVDLSKHGCAVYSAMLHAIQDLPWREDAKKVAILFSTQTPGNNQWEPERVTGYTSQTVLNAANNAGVSVYTLSGSPWVEELFQAIAEGTDGQYNSARGANYPMLNALEVTFDAIAADMGLQ